MTVYSMRDIRQAIARAFKSGTGTFREDGHAVAHLCAAIEAMDDGTAPPGAVPQACVMHAIRVTPYKEFCVRFHQELTRQRAGS